MDINPYEAPQSPTPAAKSSKSRKRLFRSPKFRRFSEYSFNEKLLYSAAVVQLAVIALVIASVLSGRSTIVRSGINGSIVLWAVCLLFVFMNRKKPDSDLVDPLE